MSRTGGRRGAPRIEDAVYIAPGAHLSGPITIGYRARIGPNAVVFRDVPARARALAGEPVVLLHETEGSGGAETSSRGG